MKTSALAVLVLASACGSPASRFVGNYIGVEGSIDGRRADGQHLAGTLALVWSAGEVDATTVQLSGQVYLALEQATPLDCRFLLEANGDALSLRQDSFGCAGASECSLEPTAMQGALPAENLTLAGGLRLKCNGLPNTFASFSMKGRHVNE